MISLKRSVNHEVSFPLNVVIYIFICTVLMDFKIFEFLFYNSYFFFIIIFVIIVHARELMYVITICLMTILARNLNFLI